MQTMITWLKYVISFLGIQWQWKRHGECVLSSSTPVVTWSSVSVMIHIHKTVNVKFSISHDSHPQDCQPNYHVKKYSRPSERNIPFFHCVLRVRRSFFNNEHTIVLHNFFVVLHRKRSPSILPSPGRLGNKRLTRREIQNIQEYSGPEYHWFPRTYNNIQSIQTC